MRVAYLRATQWRILSLLNGIGLAGDEHFSTTESADVTGTDVAVVQWWGDAVRARALGYRRVLVCELGYLGDRHMVWSSLSWNGLNGRGTHGLGPERYPEPLLEPWRPRPFAGRALILGQVPDDWAVKCALKGSYEEWLREATLELERRGYSVRLRKHPEVAALDPLPGEPPRERLLRRRARQPLPPRPTLREELAAAGIAVTLNSTAAIEAVCMGVPTVVWDRRGCMAGSVSAEFTARGLEEPSNRRAWVNRLARMQWSKRELEDGSAWKTMKELI